MRATASRTAVAERGRGNLLVIPIAMEETLEGAMARVFGGPAPQAGTELAPSPAAAREGSEKALPDTAASALARASEELRRVGELLRRLRESEREPASKGPSSRSSGAPR